MQIQSISEDKKKKKRKPETDSSTWMELEGVMLSEIHHKKEC